MQAKYDLLSADYGKAKDQIDTLERELLEVSIDQHVFTNFSLRSLNSPSLTLLDDAKCAREGQAGRPDRVPGAARGESAPREPRVARAE